MLSLISCASVQISECPVRVFLCGCCLLGWLRCGVWVAVLIGVSPLSRTLSSTGNLLDLGTELVTSLDVDTITKQARQTPVCFKTSLSVHALRDSSSCSACAPFLSAVPMLTPVVVCVLCADVRDGAGGWFVAGMLTSCFSSLSALC